MQQHFRLEGSMIVPTDQDTWIANLNANAHVVQVTPITQDVRVSTIFVGIDDRLFETKTIGGESNEEQTNSATWTDAVKAHALAVLHAHSRYAHHVLHEATEGVSH